MLVSHQSRGQTRQDIAQPPQAQAAERPVLSIPEVQSLALEVPDRYEALVHPLVWSGLRIGEAAALQSRDLDLTPGYASRNVWTSWRRHPAMSEG